MTVKELTDYLYEAGNGRDEVVIQVKGKTENRVDLYGAYHGEYTFPVELDIEHCDCEVDRDNRAVMLKVFV